MKQHKARKEAIHEITTGKKSTEKHGKPKDNEQQLLDSNNSEMAWRRELLNL
jgi:hypothetical protein